ncbi:hypothetical protein ALC53_12502 [Atta colombica]|uniref:Uncharacterized protein n=1 Tax=Atta colombica TaxID=520822 RepID=A0A151HZ12_9HYME|nr:hypothetical protein ALC53_12502 [Atta colombica]
MNFCVDSLLWIHYFTPEMKKQVYFGPITKFLSKIEQFSLCYFKGNILDFKTNVVIFFTFIVHRWPLLSPIFRIAYESRVEKTSHLLRLSTNRSNFLLLHKTGSAGQPGRVPLIETSDSQRE